MSSPSGHTPSGRADARRNAERVREVALDLLARRGSDTTVMDIAREAGVGKATVYRNFPTKGALLAFAAEHHGRWLVDRLDTAIAATDAWAGFVELVRDTMLRINTAPILLEAMGSHEEPQPAIGAALNERLEALVKRLVDGRLTRPDLTVDDLGMLIIGCSDFLARRSASPDDVARAAELVVAAIARR